jgi:hypothetical protein
MRLSCLFAAKEQAPVRQQAMQHHQSHGIQLMTMRPIRFRLATLELRNA